MDLSNPKIEKAFDWLQRDIGEGVLSKDDHCPYRDVFQARLLRMSNEMEKKGYSENDYSIIAAITGELGNNAYDHNLGKWRDEAGIYFSYDLEKKFFVIADRGQGVLSTLKRVKPELTSEPEAVKVALTESISGRAPERRGNGLKFVRQEIQEHLWGMYFQSGDGVFGSEKGEEWGYGPEKKNLFGVIAVVSF